MKNSYIVGAVVALGIAFWLGRRSRKKIDIVVARKDMPSAVEEVAHYVVHYVDIGDVPPEEANKFLERYYKILQSKQK